MKFVFRTTKIKWSAPPKSGSWKTWICDQKIHWSLVVHWLKRRSTKVVTLFEIFCGNVWWANEKFWWHWFHILENGKVRTDFVRRTKWHLILNSFDFGHYVQGLVIVVCKITFKTTDRMPTRTQRQDRCTTQCVKSHLMLSDVCVTSKTGSLNAACRENVVL